MVLSQEEASCTRLCPDAENEVIMAFLVIYHASVRLKDGGADSLGDWPLH